MPQFFILGTNTLRDIVLKLPLRALAQTGTCQTSNPFCAEYMGGQSHETDSTDQPPTTDGSTTNRTTDAPPPPVDPNGSTH